MQSIAESFPSKPTFNLEKALSSTREQLVAAASWLGGAELIGKGTN
jgi:hypothetical protein